MAAPAPNAPFREQKAFVETAKKAITMIAIWSKQSVLDPSSSPQVSKHFETTIQFLEWLEAVDKAKSMTVPLKQETRLPMILQTIYNDPRYHFAPELKTRAEKLYEAFEAQFWGGPPPAEEDVDDDDDEGAAAQDANNVEAKPRRPSTTTTKKGPKTFETLVPPADHPVWGSGKIMDGIVLRRYAATGRVAKALNSNGPKRVARVYGHNGIEVGQWFPSQLAAVVAGAHGMSEAGIHNGLEGAYSVVVSGHYKGMDSDMWDTLFYSGSGSQENEDPDRAPPRTTGTNALLQSVTTKNPVRLLRSSRAGGYAPTEGIRYDGLYDVVECLPRKNEKGGRYECFKLVRRPNQLRQMDCMRRPNPQELVLFNKIEARF